MASIVVESTPNSLTVYLTDLDPEWLYGNTTVFWYIRQEWWPYPDAYDDCIEDTIENDSVESNRITFENLRPDTMYHIRCYVYYEDEEPVNIPTTEWTLPEENSRPQDFSWTYPKTSGGEFNLTATEWNRFTERINAFRLYKGLSDYPFTTAVKGNEFKDYMYNEAREAIHGLYSDETAIPKVSAGDVVTADHLNILVEVLNSV